VVAVPPAAHLYEEEQLQGPIRNLQSLAKLARRQAMTQHQPYEIVFGSGRLTLAPADPKNSEPEKAYVLPADVTVSVKPLNQSEFKRAADQRWFFASNGLCEPMSFLFQRREDWVRFQVSPLTARIENQQSLIR
jgi:hypothetical protein